MKQMQICVHTSIHNYQYVNIYNIIFKKKHIHTEIDIFDLIGEKMETNKKKVH